ncbi:MAG TPA: type II CAAX endopeptidase family protein [Candidatus Saccharimonadales bacterium]|nr:type II CAAX endopeptidase family protein [Candidatus Saccharimonadales bacterium]
MLLVGRAFAIPIGHLDQLTPEQIGILTAGQDVTLGLSLVILLRAWPKLRPADLGLTAPIRPDLGVAVGVGLWLLSIAIANLQAGVIGAHPQSLIVAAAAHPSVVGLLIDLVFGAGVVAVVEELFFRVVLFALLRQRMRFIYAAILSSALFAIAHEISAWLPVFALGLGLAYLYERRHSLWTNAFAHGTLNAISFLLLFFLPDLGS